MAFASVGAIYATVSKLLQRIYIPHADDSEIVQQPIRSGETLLYIPIATFQSGGAQAIQAIIGIPTFSGRCAVVDGTNTVIALIIADPAINIDPRGQSIAHDLANMGDTWNGTHFTRLLAEASFATGKIISISPQNIDAMTVATTGNYLCPVGPTVLLGQTVLPAAKVGVPSTLVAGVAV
jgi:hypothetical protein